MTDSLAGAGIVGLDGHDGAGKTTLACLLADRIGGRAVRPFAGDWGRKLLSAHRNDDYQKVIDVGARAISETVARSDLARPLVLDRSWLTVGSLVPEELFQARWRWWVPTVLCWCDLPTTMARLESRPEEPAEDVSWHERFLSVYHRLAIDNSVPVVRTDTADIAATLDRIQLALHASPAR